MARSAEGKRGVAWTAGALVYSGRPDPVWILDQATGARLLAGLRALPALERPPRPSRRRLGYHGCFVSSPDGDRFTAFAGSVAEEPAGVVRRDDGRAVERAILATAPPGTLPPGLAEDVS